MTLYHNMMREYFMELVIFSAFHTLGFMISRSQERDIDLEHLEKKKTEKVQIAVSLMKRPKNLISN